MDNENIEYLRTTINTIDSLSIEIMELIADNYTNPPRSVEELAEALEATANAVTDFQEYMEWI